MWISTDTVDIRSSCETYNRKGSIVGVDGQIRDGTVFSIASVYTPEKHRRNGFAAEMLKQVRKVLLDEIPDLLASALYSDIGPTYYARLGWIPSPAMWNTEFDANNTVVVSAEVPAFQLQPIVENGELLRKVLLADRANWREKLASAGTPSLVVFQTPDSVHWHNVRGRLYQSINKRAPSGVDLSIVGVCVNDEESKPAFVLWAHNYKDDSLDVLRLAVDDTKKGVLARFVAASCEEARRTGLAKVTVWGKLDLLGAVEVGAKTYVRDESLSSLCVAPNASKKRDSVVWLGDEKGLWV
ncbi:hypothetical protein DFJ73DRAFT_465601 [Zopfochytrium polystomum]|nr:hypothetical protein DFJ73DRAFT_465601 [Zopfochytrium polystomum]